MDTFHMDLFHTALSNEDQHSATKAKDMEGNLPPIDLRDAPPVMPWRQFADWIRMGEEHDVVWGWIRNGYIPSRKVGKRTMVNVALLTHQLLDKEWT